MHTVNIKRVTIIAEAVLENRLIHDIKHAGARGYTITEARGEGTRGVRAGTWEGQNIRLETLVSEAVADRILTLLAEHYFPHFAVVAFTDTVAVVRGERYVGHD